MKKILHIFVFALILTIIFCIGVSAAEWTANGRTWTFTTAIDSSSGTNVNVATITGAKLNDGETRTSELNIPSEVYIGDTKYIVTKIGAGAFRCLSNSSRPDDIGENTKSGDLFLAKKYFGHVTIPSTVIEIGEKAFEYSAIYGTVIIPDSVKTIGVRAFRGCVGLDTVVYSAKTLSVPANCFEGCKALVEFRARGIVAVYGGSAFNGCEALLYVNYAPVAGESLDKEQCESAFKYAEDIGANAFRNTSVSGVLDLSSLKSLGDNAFYNCTFLTKVTLGVCDFKRSAFSYDENKVSTLREFIIVDENTKYCSVDSVVFNKAMTEIYFYAPDKLGEVYTIPDTVVTIKGSAFWRAKISRIEIGPNVTTIEGSAFRYSKLKNLFVPSNVKTVGQYAVGNCPEITWVIFDTGVTSVRSDSVSATTCAKLKNRAFVKNGSQTITGGIAYISGDCIDDLGFDSHFYGYLDDAPTCDTAGTYVCCLCGDNAPAKATGHSGKILSSTELSCTTPESYTVNCENCKEIAVVVVTPAPNHVLSAPTTIQGEKCSYTFSICSTCKNTVVTSFTTDAFTSGDTNDDGKIDATDVDILRKYLAGSAVVVNRYSCDINADGTVTVADLILLNQYVNASKNTIVVNNNSCERHSYIKSVQVTKESCIDGGCYVYFCADCGDIIPQSATDPYLTIPPKGHLFTDTTVTAPTCSTEGLMNRLCSVCQYSEQAPMPTTEHKFSWWMLADDELDFQYGYCAVCNVLGYEEVDRGVLDDIVASIPTDFELYCTAESRSRLRPIVANATKALTQEQVDQCISELRRILPTIQYKVTDIPVIYLESRAPVYPKTEDYVSANIIVAYKDEDGNLKSITDADGEMKVRGNATAGVKAKLPFNIKFSRDVDLLDMGYGKKYCLLANALDTSTIRNAVALEFAQALELDYTSQYRFVEVYHDGEYKGCYTVLTPIEIGEDRVDIDEQKDVVIHLSYKNGSEDAAFPSPIFGMWLMRLELPSTYTPYTKSQMIRIMHQADFAILSGDMDEMAKVMDMDSMIKYFIFHEYVKDMDMVWDSTRFYIEDGKLHGGPIWDLDISQGNVSIQTARNNGFDEHSGYHYWNQYEVYGDIVTKSELNSYGEFSSAIGPWADAFWVNDYHRTTNPTLNNGQRRWWYSYMIECSEEFRVAVAQFIEDNKTLFRSIYESVTDPETGKTTECIIDYLAVTGPAAEAINRNYTNTDAPFPASTHPNSLTYAADNTLDDALVYLRTWWKTRSEWLYDYYTGTYLKK